MGYDVSFHPISPEEMREWYFTPLTWIQQGQEEKVLALAAQHGMEDFYTEKYLNTLRVGAETESNELFDKSHGFYIAVVQGFFRDYYYTRGSGFSFLLEEKPEYARYFTPWAQVAPTAFPNPAENQIIENYCSGVYLSPKQVVQLLRDLEQMPKVLEDLEGLWRDGQFAVLKRPSLPRRNWVSACWKLPRWWNQTPSPPMRVPAIPTCTTVIEMGCIFIWTPSADRSKMLSGKVRNKYEQ